MILRFYAVRVVLENDSKKLLAGGRSAGLCKALTRQANECTQQKHNQIQNGIVSAVHCDSSKLVPKNCRGAAAASADMA